LQMIAENGKPPTHLLVSFAGLERIEMNITDSKPITSGFYKAAEIGWRLYYGTDNIAARILTGTTQNAYNLRTRWFNTNEQAVIFLVEQEDAIALALHDTLNEH